MQRTVLGLVGVLVVALAPGLAEAHGRGGGLRASYGGGYGSGRAHVSVQFAPRYMPRPVFSPPVVYAPRYVQPRVYVAPRFVAPTYVPAPCPVLAVGTVLPQLPQGSQTYVVDGYTYAYSSTNYFMWNPAQGGWVVVPAPLQ